MAFNPVSVDPKSPFTVSTCACAHARVCVGVGVLGPPFSPVRRSLSSHGLCDQTEHLTHVSSVPGPTDNLTLLMCAPVLCVVESSRSRKYDRFRRGLSPMFSGESIVFGP